jgi:hypothetical protein
VDALAFSSLIRSWRDTQALIHRRRVDKREFHEDLPCLKLRLAELERSMVDGGSRICSSIRLIELKSLL